MTKEKDAKNKKKVEWLTQLKKDLSRFALVIGIIINVLFFIYYIYLIISHREVLYALIIFSLLFAVSVAIFIIDLVYKNKHPEDEDIASKKARKKQHKDVKFVLSLTKYGIKILTTAFVTYELSIKGYIDVLGIVLNIISWIIVFIQIGFTLLLRFITWQIGRISQKVSGLFKKKEIPELEEKGS